MRRILIYETDEYPKQGLLPRGSLRDIASADTVLVHEGDLFRVVKDRHGDIREVLDKRLAPETDK